MNLIPFQAKEMCFIIERNAYNMNYGIPDFYDKDGTNILKIWSNWFKNGEEN